jgi:long-chain acyl-CoA synthetase
LVGRSKNLIIRGGTKISPLDLDEPIGLHADVAAALAAGVHDLIMGERIHGLVVPRQSEKVDAYALRQWVSEQVGKFKRPDVYHFESSFPRECVGKVDRDCLV